MRLQLLEVRFFLASWCLLPKHAPRAITLAGGCPRSLYRENVMFEIVPIATTTVDWNRFVTSVNTAIGRSPTRELDATGIPVGSLSSFIPALAEFQEKETSPVDALKNNSRLQKHMMFSFFIASDRETLHQLLIAGQDFQVIMGDPGRQREHYVLTGSLDTWRNAIIMGCQDDFPIEGREFFNKMWEFFAKVGFQDIFGKYRRKDLQDKTFKLEDRR